MSEERATNGQRAVLAAALVAAFSLHLALGPAVQIGSARPNLALCVLLTECLFVGGNTGAALGFLLGLMEASFAARFVGSLLVSRSVTGFAVGALEHRVYRDNILFAGAAGFCGTLLAEALLYLFAPQPHAARWAMRTLWEAVYNACVVLILYGIARRAIRRRKPAG